MAKYVDEEDELLDRVIRIGSGKTCYHCARQNQTDGRACEAFPDGIPQVFLGAEMLHIQPYPGDHGKQFKPKEKNG